MDRLDADRGLMAQMGILRLLEIQDMQELFGVGDYGRRFYELLHRGDRYLVLAPTH